MRNLMFLFLTFALLSCHRSLVFMPINNDQKIVLEEPQTSIEGFNLSASANEGLASTDIQWSTIPKIGFISKPEKKSNALLAEVSKVKKKTLVKIIRDKEGDSRKVKKEKDPRYTNALVMTIFGGLGTIFGISLYSIAPTGLLIFACGLVFLVGFISLLLYWANPKPKL